MEEYRFRTQSGGFTVFEGVLCSGKELESVCVCKSTDRRSAVFSFADGCTYSLYADHRKDGENEILENIEEEWSRGG